MPLCCTISALCCRNSRIWRLEEVAVADTIKWVWPWFVVRVYLCVSVCECVSKILYVYCLSTSTICGSHPTFPHCYYTSATCVLAVNMCAVQRVKCVYKFIYRPSSQCVSACLCMCMCSPSNWCNRCEGADVYVCVRERSTQPSIFGWHFKDHRQRVQLTMHICS